MITILFYGRLKSSNIKRLILAFKFCFSADILLPILPGFLYHSDSIKMKKKLQNKCFSVLIERNKFIQYNAGCLNKHRIMRRIEYRLWFPKIDKWQKVKKKRALQNVVHLLCIFKMTEISSYFQGTQFVASHGGQTSCENVRKGKLALLFKKCACQSDRFTQYGCRSVGNLVGRRVQFNLP